MRSEIVITIIGAIPALITAVVSITLNNRVLNVKLEMLQKQFDKMEEKLDKHNQVVERVAILERDNKTAFNRIDESRDEISHLRDQIMKKQAR